MKKMLKGNVINQEKFHQGEIHRFFNEQKTCNVAKIKKNRTEMSPMMKYLLPELARHVWRKYLDHMTENAALSLDHVDLTIAAQSALLKPWAISQ